MGINETAILAQSVPRRVGQKQRNALRIAIATLVIGALLYWLWQRHTHVYTDDARIGASMIEVSSRTAGQITAFPVAQGDELQPGDMIAQIDDRAARFTLAELEAQLRATESDCERVEAQIDMVDHESGGKLSAAKSQLDATLASLSAARAELEFKKSDWDRAQSLLAGQMISQRQWEDARNALKQSEQTFHRARAESQSARAAVVEAEAAQTQLKVLASELRSLWAERDRVRASVEKQKVLLDELHVASSGNGIVDETFVHEGEYVVPGQRLLLMHDPRKIWIDANVKETEIRHIERGDEVGITVDAYPDREFRGTVLRIGHSATSQFSLLPSTNPSGNFTKVTQRLPVRISIEQAEGRLRPGMMVEVAIAIR